MVNVPYKGIDRTRGGRSRHLNSTRMDSVHPLPSLSVIFSVNRITDLVFKLVIIVTDI